MCAIHLGHAQSFYLRYRAPIFLIVTWDKIDMHEWEGFIAFECITHPSNIMFLHITRSLPIYVNEDGTRTTLRLCHNSLE